MTWGSKEKCGGWGEVWEELREMRGSMGRCWKMWGRCG